MKAPKALPTVARGSSLAQQGPGGVQPAFWGALAGALAPIAIDAAKSFLS